MKIFVILGIIWSVQGLRENLTRYFEVLILYILQFLIALQDVAKHESGEQFIVGGDFADINEYPFVASLRTIRE
jgi:hypothetical protein